MHENNTSVDLGAREIVPSTTKECNVERYENEDIRRAETPRANERKIYIGERRASAGGKSFQKGLNLIKAVKNPGRNRPLWGGKK